MAGRENASDAARKTDGASCEQRVPSATDRAGTHHVPPWLGFCSACGLVGIREQQRGFATLKDISIRLKSIKNIQKITKSMKMVAAAKYAKAERDLKGARAYGVGAKTFFDNIESQDEGTKEEKQKQLLVLVTS
ncbi:hypothetical protein KIN20_012606 [Parelaphostrongylus tenuis]|uniref:ATP synthase subunit gamma, mitochondrial n=1 Tax=Parelaphostrongylus tenuis TaxID=148309 RepID=A0AAD5QN95_PARTN|nr:hypothetical protein KIN20_012606 [Parelaphostrongylus tenuis]